MDVINYLMNLNWQSIGAMTAIAWYFTHDIKVNLAKLDEDVRAQGKRTDQLYQIIVDILNKK